MNQIGLLATLCLPVKTFPVRVSNVRSDAIDGGGGDVSYLQWTMFFGVCCVRNNRDTDTYRKTTMASSCGWRSTWNRTDNDTICCCCCFYSNII
jgi:hypothetical protein